MKIVFFGTPNYALPVLTAVQRRFVTGPGKSPIVAVVTQPPRPVGRKQLLSYSPIDKWAHGHKIPIFYRAKDLLKEKIDVELGILASYGEIIPREVIDLFPKGILVIHPSLLPKYRGASPVPEAIKNGDPVTGVTIFLMDAKVDHGAIVSQFKEDVLPEDTTETLRDRLFERSAAVLVELMEPFLKGKVKPRAQDDSQATYTKTVRKEDGYINVDATDPAATERFVRAMGPWPGAWTWVKLSAKDEPKRLKILKAHLENGKIILDEVQLEGKGPVSWKQFSEGYKDAVFMGA
ncbi:MAG TPA: methionyl-tRNA formyltransferase [Patescibacteria group bacterium]|nr:methionyl-tRNA formyltransferase [Patescibacteria group bacterium]